MFPQGLNLKGLDSLGASTTASQARKADEASARALTKLIVLSVFPDTFDLEGAAAVLDSRPDMVGEQLAQVRFQHPGYLEHVEGGSYRINKSVVTPLRDRLASAPKARMAALLSMTEHCAVKVWRGGSQEMYAPLVAHILQLIAEGVLHPADINLHWSGYLGTYLCRCLDRMCVCMKRYSWAEKAFRKLLEHRHDPRCPFCAFHLYPALHAQGKLEELEQLLEDLPDLGITAERPMYLNVNVYLDILTSQAYMLALQGKGAAAQAAAAKALECCEEPYQKLNNYNNLIFALRLQGKLAEAQEYAAKAKEVINSGTVGVDVRFAAESFMTIGLLHYDLGQVQEAEENLQTAVDASHGLDDFVDVDDIRVLARYHAAKVLLCSTDKAKAAQAVLLLHEAREVQQRCAPELPFRHKLEVVMVEAVIALFTLP